MIMVRIDRFAIEHKEIGITEEWDKMLGRVTKYLFSVVIYDRLKREHIAEINTGDNKLNEEIAEQVKTMLNIKLIGE